MTSGLFSTWLSLTKDITVSLRKNLYFLRKLPVQKQKRDQGILNKHKAHSIKIEISAGKTNQEENNAVKINFFLRHFLLVGALTLGNKPVKM